VAGKTLVIVGFAGIAGLLTMVVLMGGGSVSSSADAPNGGCAVTVESPLTNSQPNSRATTGGRPVVAQKSAVLTANQMAAARTVTAVGKGMRIALRGIAIALGTAMQESTLDPDATSGRAVGLFQQQGLLYRNVNRTDPAAAARAFYEQLLARVPNYADPRTGTFADIAQAVQQSSAGPEHYAAWETWASDLAHALTSGTGTPSVTCTGGRGPGPIPIEKFDKTVTLPAEAGTAGTVVFPNAEAAIAGAAALSYLGTPYAWGGGGPNGPTKGIPDGGVADQHRDYDTVGFDCSGLTEYAWTQAGISIGGDSRTQRAIGGPVHPYSQALPGDLLFYGTGHLRNIHHVALYLGTLSGTAYMVEAPQSGEVVKVSPVRTDGDFRNEVVRPWEQ
jgi:cell wall-associated NlpC family hydrolase